MIGDADVFSVWWFDVANGAQRAVHRLEAAGRILTIHDACIVSWAPGQRRPVAWQQVGLGGPNRLAGAFWGLLVSWLFLLPISRSLSSRGTGSDDPTGEGDSGDDLGEGLQRLGLDAGFAASVRTQVVPGTSVIFVFSSFADSHKIQAAVSRTRCIAHHQLSVGEQERLHAGFDD